MLDEAVKSRSAWWLTSSLRCVNAAPPRCLRSEHWTLLRFAATDLVGRRRPYEVEETAFDSRRAAPLQCWHRQAALEQEEREGNHLSSCKGLRLLEAPLHGEVSVCGSYISPATPPPFFTWPRPTRRYGCTEGKPRCIEAEGVQAEEVALRIEWAMLDKSLRLL